MKDIFLINGYRVGCPVLPTGIAYVAQAIENAGLDYVVCDVNLQTHDQILQMVKDNEPKFIGCGSMTYEVEKNYELLLAIRKTMPNVIIVLGGPHAIAAGKDIFQDCPAVDIVIQGEGEKAIVNLLQGVPLQSIPGLLTKDSHAGPIPYEVLNINDIDFPKYKKFDLEKYGNTMNIASSRGCVHKCSFCGAPKFLGKKWRAFNVARMIEEFDYWYSKGYRQFYFSDSLFALDKKRVFDFCSYIVESGFKDILFTADGVRADDLTFEVLQQMKKANFTAITLGVESVNDRTLKFFNKGMTFNQIDAAIATADSLGFDISIYLIIGAPEESSADAMKSIMYPLKYKNITSSIVSKLVPIMGTSYYNYALEHDLVSDTSVCYPNHEAYGTNKRMDTHNPVEKIWEEMLPAIEKISKFLAMRCRINKRLKSIGLSNFGVKELNLLTHVGLNPVVSVIAGALLHLVKLTGLK